MAQKIKVENHVPGFGVWLIGWLFTIGFLKLSFWPGLWAIIVWPYYLGVHFTPLG